MSNFWADRLGVPAAPQQPAAPAPAPASNKPWWMPGATAPAAPDALVGNPNPAPQQTQAVSQTFQQRVQTVNEKVHLGDLLQQQDYTSTKARSAKDSDRCPDCDSGNFLPIGGKEGGAKRCFECGYNPMFLHSTHGVSNTGQNLPQKVARVQNATPPGAAPMGSLINPGRPIG